MSIFLSGCGAWSLWLKPTLWRSYLLSQIITNFLCCKIKSKKHVCPKPHCWPRPKAKRQKIQSKAQRKAKLNLRHLATAIQQQSSLLIQVKYGEITCDVLQVHPVVMYWVPSPSYILEPHHRFWSWIVMICYDSEFFGLIWSRFCIHGHLVMNITHTNCKNRNWISRYIHIQYTIAL